MLSFFKNLSPVELVILGSILVVLFGSQVLIKLGKTSGETVKEIKNIKKNITEAFEDDQPKANK